MRLSILVLAALGSFGLLAFSGPSASATPAPSAAPESFVVDPVHSNVLFKVMHNQASWFYARFDEVSGVFKFDEDASKCSLEVEVRTESIDTRTEKLDQHLRSPDFFDAKQFPVVRFASTKVESGAPGIYVVTGDLSLHGVTKSVTIEVEHVGTNDSRRGKIMGFQTTFVVDRTDYGMNYFAGGMIGSDVELIIAIEAGKR